MSNGFGLVFPIWKLMSNQEIVNDRVKQQQLLKVIIEKYFEYSKKFGNITQYLISYYYILDPENNQGSCASNPCGPNANCWDWESGERFLCTCDKEHPNGNPYYGCSECLYDSHCNSAAK